MTFSTTLVLGKTLSESFELLKQVFVDKAMNRTQTHEWYRRFNEGWTSVEDNENSGQPSTSKNAENIQKVCSFQSSLTIHDAAEEVWI